MSYFSAQFITESANEFELDGSRLQQVLLAAEEEHEVQIFIESGRESFRECAENFRKIRKSLSVAVSEIENCTDGEKKELELFRATAFKADCLKVPVPVEDQLAYLSELFSQFEAFYRDGPGRPPSKSSDRHPLILSALEEFACQLQVFWCEETGTRFGQEFRHVYTDADADPDAGTLTPFSEAAKFFCACAKQLDSRYEPKHCRTVMRKLNKGSQKGFRKSAQK